MQTLQIPGLDRDSVQDMFRALSTFQMQQNLLKTAAVGENEQQKNAVFNNTLFPNDSTLSTVEVYERLSELMKILRPMLAEAFANYSLQ